MSNIPFKITAIKSLHIILVALITSVILTAIFNTTVLSKVNIMNLIDYAISVTGSDISPVDSLFIARIIRQQLWQVHFLVGISLPTIIVAMLILRKLKNLTFTLLFNFTSIIYLSVIGTFLFFRKELELSTQLVEILRDSHWVGVYLFGLAIVFHLYSLLCSKKETKQ